MEIIWADMKNMSTVGSGAYTPSYEKTATQLVEQCLRGEAGAWQRLVERYARLVHSVPVRHGLSAAEVDDVGQEVFVALAQSLHQIEDPERLPAWLLTTARRFSWRALQKRQRESPSADGDLSEMELPVNAHIMFGPTPSINDLLAGWSRQETLEQGLALLPERCRNLIALIFLDPAEPSYEEISSALAIPKGSIGPTRNRCLQQLRAILEELGFDPDES